MRKQAAAQVVWHAVEDIEVGIRDTMAEVSRHIAPEGVAGLEEGLVARQRDKEGLLALQLVQSGQAC